MVLSPPLEGGPPSSAGKRIPDRGGGAEIPEPRKGQPMRIYGWMALAGLLLAGGEAGSQVPAGLNYQGILADPSGRLVEDDRYSLHFRLYASPEGGTALWQETQ